MLYDAKPQPVEELAVGLSGFHAAHSVELELVEVALGSHEAHSVEVELLEVGSGSHEPHSVELVEVALGSHEPHPVELVVVEEVGSQRAQLGRVEVFTGETVELLGSAHFVALLVVELELFEPAHASDDVDMVDVVLE